MGKRIRKHYLILPSYQIRLITFMAFIVFLGSILHGFFLYRIAGENIQESLLLAEIKTSSIWEILKPAIIVTNSLNFLLTTVFLLIITIFVSHRLVGPMFKVAGHLRKLSSGKLDISALRLRSEDEGQVLCAAVNELQCKYKQHFMKIKLIKAEIDKKSVSSEEIGNRLAEVLDEVGL